MTAERRPPERPQPAYADLERYVVEPEPVDDGRPGMIFVWVAGVLIVVLGVVALMWLTAPRSASASVLLSGQATWYCGNGSPCTRGYGPDDMVAAIDPTLGIGRGERVTVRHGGKSVVVRIVDVCLCRGTRVIDLTSGAFKALSSDQTDAGKAAFLGRGVIPVELVLGGPTPTLPPTNTVTGPPTEGFGLLGVAFLVVFVVTAAIVLHRTRGPRP